ncbi:hypothetical protein HDU99_002281 [Rhizoclosmatium hyalinum]|nr:hypothetical protein HDU99_002281 [Rhizoclosmatium hyalinum]
MLLSHWAFVSFFLMVYSVTVTAENVTAEECAILNQNLPAVFLTPDSPLCRDTHIKNGDKVLDVNVTDGSISGLKVSGYGLTHIPQFQQSDFKNFTALDLSNNKMTDGIWSWTRRFGAGLLLLWPNVFTSADAGKCLKLDEQTGNQIKLTASLDGKTISTLKANGLGLSGPLPDMTKLQSIKNLELSNNALTGSLDPSLVKFLLQQERTFKLDHNLLSGTIPPEMNKVASNLDFNCFDNNDDFNLTRNPACPPPEPCKQLNKLWPKVFTNPNAICCPSGAGRRDLSERSCRRDLNARCKRDMEDWIQFSKRADCDPCKNPCCTPPFPHGGDGSLVINCHGSGSTFKGFALDASTIDDELPDFSRVHGLVSLAITNSKFRGGVPKLPKKLEELDLSGNMLGLGEVYPDNPKVYASKNVNLAGNCFTGDPSFNKKCLVATTAVSTLLVLSSSTTESTATSSIDSDTTPNVFKTLSSSAIEPTPLTITSTHLDTYPSASEAHSIVSHSFSTESVMVDVKSSESSAAMTSTEGSPSIDTSLAPKSTLTHTKITSTTATSACADTIIASKSTLTLTKITSSTATSVCEMKSPSPLIASIAAGPIPSGIFMQNYNGDTTEIIASLNTLVPGSLNQLNANQVSSSLFQIIERVRAGDAPVTFLGAPLVPGSNAAVVLIMSRQYKFNGLPSENDIQVYNDATCSFKINTAAIGVSRGVGFSYILDRSYKSEWFALSLNADRKTLTMSVYSEHQAIASIMFSVSVGAKRAESDAEFVVVNGVGIVYQPVEARTSSTLMSSSASVVPAATSVTANITATIASTSVSTSSAVASVASPLSLILTKLTEESTRLPEQATKPLISVVPPTPSVSPKFNIITNAAYAYIISSYVVLLMVGML